jgi:magnesium transporter
MPEKMHINQNQNNLEKFIKDKKYKKAIAQVAVMHPAEIADIISNIEQEFSHPFISRLKINEIAEIIHYIDPIFRANILKDFKINKIADLLKNLSDDIATDILQSFPIEIEKKVLLKLPKRTTTAIDKLSIYEADTAGGRMTGQKISVKPNLTIFEVQEKIRSLKPDFRQPFYIYVVNEKEELIGTMNLRTLFSKSPNIQVADVTDKNVISVLYSTDQEEAARLLKQYNLLALPVLDKTKKLLGTVTHDDLVDILEQEATEDMYMLVGVDALEDLKSIRKSIRFRLPWLMVNLILVMIAAYTISIFENTLNQLSILAVFLPVIAGQGGNAGIQTLTVVVRSLALGRITLRDTFRLIKHELISGLIIGIITAFSVGLLTTIWMGNPILGLVVGVSLIASVLIGVLSGLLIPMGLTKLKQDPALSAGIWLTAITDLLGFLVYLTLATFLLKFLLN